MNLKETKDFLDSCPQLICIQNDMGKGRIANLSKEKVFEDNEYCYLNTLSNQAVSLVYSNDKTSFRLYISMSFPNNWLRLTKTETEQVITSLKYQKESLMVFTKRESARAL